MAEYELIENIIKHSQSKIWDAAKREWKPDGVILIEKDEEPGCCLCGHYPIKELCRIRNKYTGENLIVGNCCITKFSDIKSQRYFDSLKRVKADHRNSFNADFINMVYDQDIINDWEAEFYLRTWRKRYLSNKQIDKRVQINEKILRYQPDSGGELSED